MMSGNFLSPRLYCGCAGRSHHHEQTGEPPSKRPSPRANSTSFVTIAVGCFYPSQMTSGLIVRAFAIVLILLVGAATISAARAAQLDCIMVTYIDPNTHENFYLKIAPGPMPPPGFTLDRPPPPPGATPLKCVWQLLRGPIVAGDYERIVKAIRESWPDLTMLDLDSPGGSGREALHIGRLLHRYLITTNVPAKSACEMGDSVCSCASACALIWFGGVERIGLVGLHRPRIDDPEFASATPEEGAKQYRLVLSEIESYLNEMEVPRPLIDDLLATSSSEIKWISSVTQGVSRPPSYAEWEDATCHDKFNPESGPFIDPCRGPLRASRAKQLSPP
jgi:hypothetical protein